jgi:hypothetical protein
MRRKLMTVAAVAAAAVVVGTGVANAATGWAVQPTPPVPGTTQSQLTGVSCVTSTNCTAVGYYRTGLGISTLAEQWNGSAWTIESTPNSSQPLSYLTGVSCPSATDCTAVGYSASDSGFTHLPLAEQWNGSTWTIQTITVRSTSLKLTGVSCHTADSCTAVTNGTVALQWNGTAWRTEALSFAAGTSDQSLDGVSCGSAADCVAVGTGSVSLGTTGGLVTLAEQRTGLTWSALSPADPGAVNNWFYGVSCHTTTDCTAVGQYDNSGGTGVTLAESWNGSAWSVQTTPNPAISTGATLMSVSCPLATSCTAVGSYTISSGASFLLAEHWGGSKWLVQPVPNPSGFSTRNLASVSCALASTCSAVGSESPKNGQQVTVAAGN